MKSSWRFSAAFSALVVVGLTLLLRFREPLIASRSAIERLFSQLQHFMSANWLAFALGQIGVTASGVLPASMMAVIAGATYGLAMGLLISVSSTMIGGWLAFAICRTALRSHIERWIQRFPTVSRLDKAITTESWRFVLLLRISPVMPFAITSYGLGLTRISQRDYLIGTMASLPALAAYVTLGALGKQSLMMTMNQASPLHWLSLAAGAATVIYALFRVRTVLSRVGHTEGLIQDI